MRCSPCRPPRAARPRVRPRGRATTNGRPVPTISAIDDTLVLRRAIFSHRPADARSSSSRYRDVSPLHAACSGSIRAGPSRRSCRCSARIGTTAIRRCRARRAATTWDRRPTRLGHLAIPQFGRSTPTRLRASYTEVRAWLVDGQRGRRVRRTGTATNISSSAGTWMRDRWRRSRCAASNGGMASPFEWLDRPRAAAAVPAALRACGRRPRPRRARRAVRSRRHRSTARAGTRTVPDYLESMRNLPRPFTLEHAPARPTRSSSSKPAPTPRTSTPTRSSSRPDRSAATAATSRSACATSTTWCDATATGASTTASPRCVWMRA